METVVNCQAFGGSLRRDDCSQTTLSRPAAAATKKAYRGEFEMRRVQKGFTIIELVVVIVILGILAAVAFPKFQDLSGDARTAVLNGGKAAIQSAAVITFAKNQGVKSSLASILAQTTLDSAIQTGSSTCSAVTLTHSGGGSIASFDISEYCS
jgi:MSHA pilin protein MshA